MHTIPQQLSLILSMLVSLGEIYSMVLCLLSFSVGSFVINDWKNSCANESTRNQIRKRATGSKLEPFYINISIEVNDRKFNNFLLALLQLWWCQVSGYGSLEIKYNYIGTLNNSILL